MGSSGSCCGNDSSELNTEQKEISGKQAAPGAANHAFQGPEVKAPEAAKDLMMGGAEYEIIVDKSKGTRLGVDVDHQDGMTLLIEGISPGLIETWNIARSKEPHLMVNVGDRIVAVNDHRGDVLQLVHECKGDKVLNMKLRRA
mmetsp:Transcript_74678/g.192713  ORF Transcript_74678/g.192713 Transcript_74678/m.192713 type:complete len:143 (+) Transcript_74678:56-484(+)